jgi:predicted metal-binding transcription factor (methanogenesis marker protein 9)
MQDVVMGVIDIPAVGRYNESTELRNDDGLRPALLLWCCKWPKVPCWYAISNYLTFANLSLYRTVDV